MTEHPPPGTLTAVEQCSLTLWAWRYLLRMEGITFTRAEAQRLCFARWLHEHGYLVG